VIPGIVRSSRIRSTSESCSEQRGQFVELSGSVNLRRRHDHSQPPGASASRNNGWSSANDEAGAGRVVIYFLAKTVAGIA